MSHTDDRSECATADALGGVMLEVDALRRMVEPLTGLPNRVEDLARLVAHLADSVAVARFRSPPAPSWMVAPTSSEAISETLGDLCTWLHAVYLRYPDGAAGLPQCWLWHPEVVEELVWLMHAWHEAYLSDGSSVGMAGDWHDRQRPGVVRRIRQSAGSCSNEKHMTRPSWNQVPTGAVAVPGAGAVAAISSWWAEGRDDPAPEPTAGEGSSP